jgi:hypothetical protein
MTVDHHISDDLAIVGRVSGARLLSLEATLSRIGDSERKPALVGFAASYVQAMRFARASAGIAVMSSVALLVLYLDVWHDNASEGLVDRMAHTPTPLLAVCVAGFAALAHLGASRLSLSAKRRDPDRLARLSVAALIGGSVAFLQFFGTAFVLGGGDVVQPQLVDGAAPTTAVVLAGCVIGCGVCARTGIPRRGWMLPVGLLMLVVTIAVGVGTGPVIAGTLPPFAVRIAITGTGVVALALIVTSIVQRVHELDDQYAS